MFVRHPGPGSLPTVRRRLACASAFVEMSRGAEDAIQQSNGRHGSRVAPDPSTRPRPRGGAARAPAAAVPVQGIFGGGRALSCRAG